MQTLTANLQAILKSKFMAGANGHNQKVMISPTGLGPSDLHDFYSPSVTKMPNGQAGLMFRAKAPPYGAGDVHVYWMSYKTESRAYLPVQIFSYNTIVFGTVVWNGVLLAVCWDATSGKLRQRQSSDNGATWTVEADLLSTVFLANQVLWGGGASLAFQISTDRAGTNLYLFYIDNTTKNIRFITTSNTNPTLGWSADADTGFHVPSVRRNYGGSTARNQGDTRAFYLVQSKGTATVDVGTGATSAGKTYTKDQVPSTSYPDTGGTELTDGNIGSSNDFYDASWQGFNFGASVLNVTVDLGASYSLTDFRAWFYKDNPAGIYLPTSMEILTSPDNITYTSQGTTLAAAGVLDLNKRWSYTLSVAATARYVRFRVTGSSTWLFISEVQAFVAGGTVAGTRPVWVVASESDDGDWHANHMAARGAVGYSGSWYRTLNAGYGGGLSGGQGANGGVFLNRNGDPIFYVLGDNGDSVTVYKSTDAGLTWTNVINNVIPAGISVGIGVGAGYCIPTYTNQEYFWGGTAGLQPATGLANDLYVVAINDGAAPANLAAVAGADAAGFFDFPGAIGTPVDMSSRVLSISLDKSTTVDSDQFTVVLDNTDQYLNVLFQAGGAATPSNIVSPGNKVVIQQWYGAVANAVTTFTGFIDAAQEHDSPHTVTVVGRDYGKKLLTQEIITTGPQDFDSSTTNPVQTTANGVYINKTAYEVLYNLINYWGQIPSGNLAGLIGSNYSFRKLIFSDGTKIMDCVKRAADLAGLEVWVDELGNWKSAPIAAKQATSVWTYRATEDVTVVDPQVSDDSTYTRVRVLGRANIGGKYLSETLIWSGLGDPRGIAFDPTDGKVWYLNGPSGNLYKLDPANNMAVISGPLNLGLGFASSLARDSVDGHLWVVDGFDGTINANINRKYKKVNNSTGATMIGPYTTPNGGFPARIEEKDATNLFLLSYSAPSRIYTTDKAGAAGTFVNAPVNYGMGLCLDGGGGLFMTRQDGTDIFQVDYAGNLINTIPGPAKDPTELTITNTGQVYAVYQPWNSIVYYTVVTNPSVPTATLAEAFNATLEAKLNEKRLVRITDMAITDVGAAQATANRQLLRVQQYSQSIPIGTVANPGLQKGDRVTVVAPGSTLNGDWVCSSVRTNQDARGGTYMATLVLTPYIGTGV